ncbi:MAG: pitrilysin family protein [Bacilli bacterium]|nr:pitrilysin family protein [Bacilli bacterium]MDD3121761.1 pitrilysin family protein [Bacilli bacterium]
MAERKIVSLNEKIYYETLNNGLKVKFIQKENFNKTYVFFGTKYGALYNEFYMDGIKYNIPLGAAHFLEHQLFQEENGTDISDFFETLSLNSNASTDYHMTVYYISGNDNIYLGIEKLLDFVQSPSFTEESVDKEKGIIIQELNMYLDKEYTIIRNGIKANLFVNSPLKYDVGGTIESVRKITKEDLYNCYNAFYQPSNMELVIVGGGNWDEYLHLIKKNQYKKILIKREVIPIIPKEENNIVATKHKEVYKDLSFPLAGVGVKIIPKFNNKYTMFYLDKLLEIFLEIKYGPTSDNYRYIIDNRLVTTEINFYHSLDEYSGVIYLNGKTKNPDKLIKYLKKTLIEMDFKINQDELNIFKKAHLGAFIQNFDSFSFLAYELINADFFGQDFFSIEQIIYNLKVEDFLQLKQYFVEQAITSFIISNKKE